MKNINLFLICLFQLALLQLAVGQATATDENGRPAGTTPQQVVASETAPVTNNYSNNNNFNGSDQDIPGDEHQQSNPHTFYPQDMDVLHDELINSSSPAEMVEQIEALRRLSADLLRSYEELRRENQLIRRSLNSCCSRDQLGLSANDAYLLQNAPNPLRSSTTIGYYIPEGLQHSKIEVRDVKGVLLETFEVEAKGMGELTLDGIRYQSGTYLYYLAIDGEVIDSKVMVINQ